MLTSAKAGKERPRTHSGDAFERHKDEAVVRRTAPLHEYVRSGRTVERAGDALFPRSEDEGVEERIRLAGGEVDGRSQVDVDVNGGPDRVGVASSEAP